MGRRGLAVVGGVAWTVVNNHVREALARVSAGHALAAARLGNPIYDHALPVTI